MMRYYQLKEFKRFNGLIHGFSTREFGDMRIGTKRSNFLGKLNLNKENLVLMEQVHGDKVEVVNSANKSQVLPEIDGMVTRQSGIVLGVKTADCLPVLFYDPRVKIIGAAHAGWRGVIKRIGQKIIKSMIRTGSNPGEILVGVGPYIGGCCYAVNKERTTMFKKSFRHLPGMIKQKKDNLYLDLAIPLAFQLIQSGVKRKNIFVSPLCTSCENEQFFSYRKDRPRTYGEMLGVIFLV